MRSTQRKIWSFSIILALLLVQGCSTTSVTGVWQKRDYTGGPFSNILVVGLTRDDTSKIIWEDIMADQLLRNNVNATTSGKCFPGDPYITKGEILDYVKKTAIDGVLVTRLVDVKEEKAYYPPVREYYHGYYYGGPGYRYYNHFGTFYDTVYAPGYTRTYNRVLLETNLYDATTQELVLSISSDTFDPSSASKLAQSVSKKVVSTLRKHNLIRTNR